MKVGKSYMTISQEFPGSLKAIFNLGHSSYFPDHC